MGVIVDLSNSFAIASNNIIYIVSKLSSDSAVNTVQLPPAQKICQSEDTKTANPNSDDIVSLIASKDEKFLAATTQGKRLVVWNVPTWTVHKEETLVKRPMAIVFSPDSTAIIVADKNGDVYSFPLNTVYKSNDNSVCEALDIDVEPGPEPLLGHLSMLLDLAITNDGKFLLTSDRDEKIRVSCYPNCYNIHTFCLGHTEFVSHIRLLPRTNDRLLSASGDGKLILWNFLKGEKILCFDLRHQIESLIRSFSSLETASEEQMKQNLSSTYISNLEVAYIGSENYMLVVSFDRLPLLVFYKIDGSEEKFSYLYSQNLSFPPLDFRFLDGRELLVFMNISLKEDEKNSLEEAENSLQVFQFSEDFKEIQNVPQHFILNFGQKYREKLKSNTVLTLDANSLFKHNKYDNVSDYLRKKQERLNIRSDPVKRKTPEI